MTLSRTLTRPGQQILDLETGLTLSTGNLCQILVIMS